DDPGGGAEEQVTDEDRGGVAEAGVGALHAPAQLRLVHDVVVVERGQVGQLDPDGGVDHPLVPAVPDLAGQQGQQRPEALAAGGHQVPGGLGDERVVVVDDLLQTPGHRGHAV